MLHATIGDWVVGRNDLFSYFFSINTFLVSNLLLLPELRLVVGLRARAKASGRA